MKMKTIDFCLSDKPKTERQKSLQIYPHKSTGSRKGVVPSSCQHEDTTQTVRGQDADLICKKNSVLVVLKP